jgi:hypothetical protein
VGSVSGDVQTLLNVSIPAWDTTIWTKREPCSYCFIFRSMPRMRRRACSMGPAVLRREENLARICSTEGTTVGPTASMT